MKLKRCVAFILAFLMTVTLLPAANVFAEEEQFTAGDIITYGGYPQSEVTDRNITAALFGLSENAEWTSYGYYSGFGNTGSMSRNDNMQYCDISYNGSTYRGVKFSEYRPDKTIDAPDEDFSNQRAANYLTNNIYWFRWEPLRWRVLDPVDGLVISEKLIDAQAYNNTVFKIGETFYKDFSGTEIANNYISSSIRAWLSDDFYNTAFSEDEKDGIADTVIDNTAYNSDFSVAQSREKVFLLSYSEAQNPMFGFSTLEGNYDLARIVEETDYAKCQGGDQSWWLRTAGYYSDEACFCTDEGRIAHTGFVKGSYTWSNKYYDAEIYYVHGVRPLFRFGAGISQSDNPDGGLKDHPTDPQPTDPQPTEPQPTVAPTEPEPTVAPTEPQPTEPQPVAAQTPQIDEDIDGEDSYLKGERAAEIRVSAFVTDGGTLSYQWYRNSVDSPDGASIIHGATKSYYTPVTDEAGEAYYFVMVTNTNPDADPQSAVAVSGFRRVSVTKYVTLEDLSYSFVNAREAFHYPDNFSLPIEVYNLVFGDEGAFRYEHDGNGRWNGNCFGMTGTSLLFFVDGNDISIGDFNASSVADADVNDRNVSLNLSLLDFIEAIQITQIEPETNRFYTTNKNDLNRLCAAVEHFSTSGTDPVIVAVFGNDSVGRQGGHAVIGYRLEQISAKETRMHVYDPNFPQTDRYINLTTDNEGNFVSWSYQMNDRYDWGTGRTNSYISFIPFSSFSSVWENRGSIDDNGALSLVSITAEDAVIYNTKSEVVAQIENGSVVSFAGGAQPVITIGMTSDDESTGLSVNSLWLPAGEYGVENKSEEKNTIGVSMMNAGIMADVETDSRKVHLNVNGKDDLNDVRIISEPGDTYSIDLYSSVNQVLSLSGEAADTVVGASMTGGEFTGVGIAGLGDAEGSPVQTFTVRYDANGGDGVPYSQTKIAGLPLKLAEKTPYRDGYTFVGWALSADAENADHAPGAEYTADEDATLYAVWAEGDAPAETDAPETEPPETEEPTATEPPETEAPTEPAGEPETTEPAAEPETTEPVSPPADEDPMADMLLGDVDGTGRVAASDARFILRHAARVEQIPGAWALLADINRDGYVKANDARLALRMAAKIDPLIRYGDAAPAPTTEPTSARPTTPPTEPPTEAPTEPPAQREPGVYADTESVSLKPGGVALVKITDVLPDDDPYTISAGGSGDGIAVVWAKDLDGNYSDYIAIAALAPTENATAYVYVKEVPSMRVDISVTVGDDGSDSYVGLPVGNPITDYGALFGVHPTQVIVPGESSANFAYAYTLDSLFEAGATSETMINEFTDAITFAGFRPVPIDELEDLVFARDDTYVLFNVVISDDNSSGYVLIQVTENAGD